MNRRVQVKDLTKLLFKHWNVQFIILKWSYFKLLKFYILVYI